MPPVSVSVAARPPIGRATRLTALIVASAMFMQNVDSTVIATALPAMARDFGSDPIRMNVALTSYLLSLSVFIPASGWVADRYGTRTVFRAAIAIFTVGSILCGRAETLPFLVAARVLQGVGGAMMIPVGRLVLLRSVKKSELVAAMAWLTVPSLIGPVVGPPLGGFIVTYWSWRWIFLINVPIGVLGVVLVSLYIEDAREPPRGPFDWFGLLLTGTALAGFMFGVETAGRGLLPASFTWAMFAVSALSALGYWLHARRSAAPLLDFSLMRVPSFAVSVYAGSLFRLGIGAIPFLLPLMLQLGFGDTAARGGTITLASSAGALFMKPVATRALRLFGFRDTLVWNGAVCTLLLAACALFRPNWPVAALYAVLLVGGFLRSLQFTAFNTIAYADVSREGMSAATSLYSTLQQVSLTIGITAGAAALEVAMAFHGDAAPATQDFSAAFIVVALVSGLAAPAALLMPRDAGAELAGR